MTLLPTRFFDHFLQMRYREGPLPGLVMALPVEARPTERKPAVEPAVEPTERKRAVEPTERKRAVEPTERKPEAVEKIEAPTERKPPEEALLMAIAERVNEKQRVSYGVLIIVSDDEIHHQNKPSFVGPCPWKPASSSYVLCVRCYISYQMRVLMYHMLKFRPGSPDQEETIKELASSLSPREFGILRSQRTFTNEVYRVYAAGKRPAARRIMANYSTILSFLSDVHPAGDVNERRWSPPKGGASTATEREETEMEVIWREVKEETGMEPHQYRIVDTKQPIELEYISRDGYFRFRLKLYIAQLTEDIPFPRYYESGASPLIPKPALSDEIDRVALIPISLLDRFLPSTYGLKLQKQLQMRLGKETIPPVDEMDWAERDGVGSTRENG